MIILYKLFLVLVLSVGVVFGNISYAETNQSANLQEEEYPSKKINEPSVENKDLPLDENKSAAEEKPLSLDENKFPAEEKKPLPLDENKVNVENQHPPLNENESTEEDNLSLLKGKIKVKFQKIIGKNHNLRIELFNRAKKTYNCILRIVTELLKPLEHNKTCRGGQERVILAADILNQLLIIHKYLEYGSPNKKRELDRLIKKAQKKFIKIQEAPKGEFSLRLEGDYEPEVVEFFSIKIKEKEIKIGGPVLSVGLIGASGIGILAGRSKTPYGIRRAIVSGKAAGGVGIGSLLTVGINSFKSTSRKKIFKSSVLTGKGGFIIGGGGNININMTNNNSINEGGIGIGGFGLKEGIGGLEIFSLPTDLKYFRNNIGLTPEAGKLPLPPEKK